MVLFTYHISFQLFWESIFDSFGGFFLLAVALRKGQNVILPIESKSIGLILLGFFDSFGVSWDLLRLLCQGDLFQSLILRRDRTLEAQEASGIELL